MITCHSTQIASLRYNLLHLFLLFAIVTACVGQDRPLTKEEEVAYERYRRNNHTLKGDADVSNMSVMLGAYALENQGRLPNSWADLDRQYGPKTPSAKKDWEDLKRMVAVIPQIQGDFPDPEFGKMVRLTMVMVLTAPLDQRREMKNAVGRWVLWLGPEGKIFRNWYAETDIQRFSAWPQVQKVIDTAKAEQEAQAKAENQQPQASESDRLPLNLYPKPNEPVKAALPSESHERGWLIWLLVIFAALVAFWRLLRKPAR